MKYLMILAIAAICGANAFASNETCYQLGRVDGGYSRTAELMCIEEQANGTYNIELKINEIGSETIIATFNNLNLLRSAKCMECNADLYGIANPSNSIFNEISILFNGTRNFGTKPMTESGTVSIGTNKFTYRSF